MGKYTTLAIETSCDDTSIGIVTFDGDFFGVEKLLAYTQVDTHNLHGGVVPEIASRLHSEQIIKVLEGIGWDAIKDVDFISVTTHPGLPGSLVVGKAAAALLGSRFGKPIVEVNHIQGHIFSLLLERNFSEIQFPMVVLTASGGHNDIYLVQEDLSYTKLGQTLDDAAGECFDKVSRMLGGPYPGGAWIGEMAEKWKEKMKGDSLVLDNKSPLTPLSNKGGDMKDIHFKRIFLTHDSYDFSFSGMKSQVSILLKKLEEENKALTQDLIEEIAYEFQEAVVEVLVKKLFRAGIAHEAKTLGIAGGVSCNERLREYLNAYVADKTGITIPTPLVIKPMKKVYSMDNAAMIGCVGLLHNIQDH